MEEEKKVTLKDILPEKITSEDIMAVIKRWVEYNEGNVLFFGRFVTIDMEKVKYGKGHPEQLANGLVVDAVDPTGEDISCAFGDAELLKEFAHAMFDEMNETDEEFIDW